MTKHIINRKVVSTSTLVNIHNFKNHENLKAQKHPRKHLRSSSSPLHLRKEKWRTRNLHRDQLHSIERLRFNFIFKFRKSCTRNLQNWIQSKGFESCRRCSLIPLFKGSRNEEALNLRRGHRMMTFFLVSGLVLGVVLAIKDKRDLGEIIHDIIRKK